jgi:hypothetical protein
MANIPPAWRPYLWTMIVIGLAVPLGLYEFGLDEAARATMRGVGVAALLVNAFLYLRPA